MKEEKRLLKTLKRYLIITVATIIYSAGIALFLDPYNLAAGGIMGISIILNHIFGMKTGTLILLFNVPIMAVALWKFGHRFLISTCYVLVLATFLINRIGKYLSFEVDMMLAGIAGGVLCGIGMAIIFRENCTTGGMDILVKLLRIRFPYLKTGTLYFMMDAFIIIWAGVVFGTVEAALYAAIADYITSHAMNLVLYGSDEARLFYIISDETKIIADRLMKELDIGVTFLEGRGGYSNKYKDVILCVTPKKLAPQVLEFVSDIDRNAFMFACNANEIYGEGYKSYDSMIL